MAEELAASAFLTAAIKRLFARLNSREFVDFFRDKKSMDGQLKILKAKLKTASIFLDDAEERQVVEPCVKEWLDDLKDIVFKLDDMVEEVNAELLAKKRRFGYVVLTFFSRFDESLQAEILRFLKGLDILLSRVVFLDLKISSPQIARSSLATRSYALSREACHVHGRDAQREEILELLISSDERVWGNKIGVLPIVGTGGLGKTTLAQLVYDDERVEEHKFDLKAWVTLSTESDVSRIMKRLLQHFCSREDTNELAMLQRYMIEDLRGKKFLFVLDDVWDEDIDNWDLLMSSFATGDPGSKIIVTTRSAKVCSNVKNGPIHELSLVSDEDCWKIFVHHAFDGDWNADPQLEEIGRRIVEKCKGVPLAVKSVGGLLRYERNPEKWETISGSQVWEWSRNEENRVHPSLWLSYRYMPSSVKQCFAYCSMFPKHYEFDRKDVILWWMAEGFLQPDTIGKSLEEVGNEYFEDLISRSFFQEVQTTVTPMYVMHDLVHNLAIFVAGAFCLSKKLGNTTSKTRYLLCNGVLESESVKALSEATYMSTTDSLVEEILEATRFLRVLSLPRRNISKWLSSPRNGLKHLRYLNLSDSEIEEVPDSICTLYNLQTLVLSNCYSLSKLPTNMRNLINLRHLDTTHSDQIKKMPPGMGNLKLLRTLTNFVVCKADNGCSSINELGELQHLGGTIHVNGLQNMETTDAARKANFKDKASIRDLFLEWEGETSDPRRERDVLDALQPHTNLEMLFISGYAASSFPIWVGDSSFSKIVTVKLSGNGNGSLCSLLPPLGQLPSLKSLRFYSFNNLEKIGSEFYGHNSSITPFQSLEDLDFEDMKRWDKWSFVGIDGNKIGCFPRLKYLGIKFCPNLGAGSLPDCETLETLEINHSYNSMECFSLDKFRRLKSLSLFSCKSLKSITSSAEDGPFPFLTSLAIQNCPAIESLPRGLPLSLISIKSY